MLTNKKRTLIFLCLVISCIATSMLATALTTALPLIIKDLAITTSTGQWLTSGYSLAMGIAMPLSAFLITRFPTKKLYLSALGIFLIGTVIAIFAPNFPILMVARVFQAVGNGILTSMAQVILLSIYPKEKLGTVMGWYGLSVTAAPVIAPTLAGVVVDAYGWRAIFVGILAIVALSFIVSSFVFADVLETTKKQFDVLSFAISALAFGGITLGLGNLGVSPFMSFTVLGCLAIGVIAGIFFVYRQLRLTEPFLDVRVFSERTFTLSVIGSMLMYMVMMGSSVIMPIYIQSYLGYSALVSGLVVLPGSLAMALVSPLAGRMYDQLGMKKLFIVGSLLLALSSGLMFFVQAQTGLWAPVILNLFRSVAIGCLMMPFVTWGTSGLTPKQTAHGTALLTSLRTIAGAIGSAVFVSVMSVASQASQLTGVNANMFGLHIAFISMAVIAIILVLLGVKGVTEK
ncbi:MDR family MFS transporter [Ligilactobacillus apodemi]|uniref:MDR family MFS transporter n=1 Tax=Ligilactobacillus apodemi TaxID=307126 RepID=UPI00214B505B|nr:MDR family MFS transporter [Ligilactobacillus apodemi]MCR1902073.1 multidrug efflux MFS transporter [Ligilactobacillus apodemi]